MTCSVRRIDPPPVAAALILRMHELGAKARGKAASQFGFARFDRDSAGYLSATQIEALDCPPVHRDA
jgi:hypothetical protein